MRPLHCVYLLTCLALGCKKQAPTAPVHRYKHPNAVDLIRIAIEQMDTARNAATPRPDAIRACRDALHTVTILRTETDEELLSKLSRVESFCASEFPKAALQSLLDQAKKAPDDEVNVCDDDAAADLARDFDSPEVKDAFAQYNAYCDGEFARHRMDTLIAAARAQLATSPKEADARCLVAETRIDDLLRHHGSNPITQTHAREAVRVCRYDVKLAVVTDALQQVERKQAANNDPLALSSLCSVAGLYLSALRTEFKDDTAVNDLSSRYESLCKSSPESLVPRS